MALGLWSRAINHVEHDLPTLSGLKYYAQAAAMLRQAISCEWLTQRAIWELKHVQYDADNYCTVGEDHEIRDLQEAQCL